MGLLDALLYRNRDWRDWTTGGIAGPIGSGPSYTGMTPPAPTPGGYTPPPYDPMQGDIYPGGAPYGIGGPSQPQYAPQKQNPLANLLNLGNLAQLGMLIGGGKYGGYGVQGYQQAEQQDFQNELKRRQLETEAGLNRSRIGLEERRISGEEEERRTRAEELKAQREQGNVSAALTQFESGLSGIDASDPTALTNYAESIAETRGLTPEQTARFMKVAERRAALKPPPRPLSSYEEKYNLLTKMLKREPTEQEALGILGIAPTKPVAGRDIPLPPEVEAQQARLRKAGQVPPMALEETTPDPTSQSILAQTGLSYPAFLVLTGRSSQLPRDANTRRAAFSEAQKWANKQGVDVSTMGSQYGAYNDVLARNIARMSNTKIMENELQGTLQNLQGVVNEKDLGKLRFENVAKIWAGQEVNDNLAQQYAMHLYQLRQELAGYGAATQGRSGNEITLNDYKEAEKTIKSGISTGSIKGLATAVANSTEKMGVVMQKSVHAARQAVWDLFGVGKNYKGQQAPDTEGSVPAVGGTFNGEKVIGVKRIQ